MVLMVLPMVGGLIRGGAALGRGAARGAVSAARAVSKATATIRPAARAVSKATATGLKQPTLNRSGASSMGGDRGGAGNINNKSKPTTPPGAGKNNENKQPDSPLPKPSPGYNDDVIAKLLYNIAGVLGNINQVTKLSLDKQTQLLKIEESKVKAERENAFDASQNGSTNVLDSMKILIGNIFDRIKSEFSFQAQNVLFQAGKAALGGLALWVVSDWEKIKGVWSQITNFSEQSAGWIKEGLEFTRSVATWVVDIGTAFKDLSGTIINSIGDIINWAADSFKGTMLDLEIFWIKHNPLSSKSDKARIGPDGDLTIARQNLKEDAARRGAASRARTKEGLENTGASTAKAFGSTIDVAEGAYNGVTSFVAGSYKAIRDWAGGSSDGAGLSEDLKSYIRQKEGLRLKAYKDGTQKDGSTRYSIGYGTISHAGETITKDVAEARMIKELARVRMLVKQKTSHLNLSEKEIDALTSFTYNLGDGNLDKLLAGGTRTKQEVGAKMLEYNKVNGSYDASIAARRREEAAMFGVTDFNVAAKRYEDLVPVDEIQKQIDLLARALGGEAPQLSRTAKTQPPARGSVPNPNPPNSATDWMVYFNVGNAYA